MTDHVDVALKASRKDFDALAEGVVWQDDQGQIVDANAAAAPILGLTHDELLGRTSRDPRWYAVHEDGSPWPGSEHPGMVALRTGLPQRGNIMGIFAPQLGRRWIAIHSMPQFAPEKPRPVGVVTSFVDVTAHIELRQRLQEQSRELGDLYNEAPCGYHMLDKQGRYLKINDTALSWLGVERDAVVGIRGPSDFMTEASRQVFAANFPRIVAGETLEGIEVETVGANGNHRWVRVSARPVFDDLGQFIATRSVLHDMTDVRASQGALEGLIAKQQLMLDNDIVGLVRVKDRRIIWKNRAFANMFGYSEGELLGQETSILYPDRASFEAFDQVYTGSLAQGRTFRAQMELRRKNRSAIWVDCSGALLDPESGEAMWFSKDITAQRHEQALMVQSAELEAENRQLRETTRLHSIFLSNMSHELRTPLNAVIGFADILKLASVQADVDKRTRYLAQIKLSGEHLLSMIESILELARLEGGRIPLQPSPVELDSLIGEVVGILEAKALQRKVSVRVEVPSDIPEIRLDALRLKQVLLNYIGNAIKFSKPDGSVFVRAFLVGRERLRLEVEDNGIGIAEEDKSRLFVRFQQLSVGNAKAYEGTGIGLALVKQIVDAQGGQVGVSSAPELGSIFWVELPLAA